MELSSHLDETVSTLVCMLGLHQVCIKFASSVFLVNPNSLPPPPIRLGFSLSPSPQAVSLQYISLFLSSLSLSPASPSPSPAPPTALSVSPSLSPSFSLSAFHPIPPLVLTSPSSLKFPVALPLPSHCNSFSFPPLMLILPLRPPRVILTPWLEASVQAGERAAPRRTVHRGAARAEAAISSDAASRSGGRCRQSHTFRQQGWSGRRGARGASRPRWPEKRRPLVPKALWICRHLHRVPYMHMACKWGA